MTEQESAAEAEQQTNELVQEGQAMEAEAPAPQEDRMVPLKALEEERRKRQELEYQSQWMQQQLQQSQLAAQTVATAEPEEETDEYTKELMNRIEGKIRNETQRVIEAQYLQDHPDCLDRIQRELAPILEKKPWLAGALQGCENRYARAMEIINDYAPRREDDTTRRMVENAEKPRSPAQGAAKGGSVSRLEMMSKMSTSEFGQWRDQLRKQRR